MFIPFFSAKYKVYFMLYDILKKTWWMVNSKTVFLCFKGDWTELNLTWYYIKTFRNSSKQASSFHAHKTRVG